MLVPSILNKSVLAANVIALLIISSLMSKYLQYFNFSIHDWDTGIYSNVVWNIVTGEGFHSDVLDRNHLGEHFSPVTAVFAPLFLLSPSPLWLLVGQGLSVGLCYLLLYLIGRTIFQEAFKSQVTVVALGFAVLAAFYRPLSSALLFEFHPTTLTLPFVCIAFLALLHNRTLVFWISIAVLLSAKENAPLVLLGFAIYARLVLQRSHLAVWLVIVAAVAAVVTLGVVMPYFRDGSWGHASRFGPHLKLAEKATYLLGLVQPLAFLPVFAWRCLVAALPMVALNLSVSYEQQFSLSYHYDDFASVFLLVAAMHGLVAIQRQGRLAEMTTLIAAATAAVVAISVSSRGVLSPVLYVVTDLRGDTRPARQLLHELEPFRYDKSFGIAADQAIGPYVSLRTRYVAMYGPQRPIPLQRLAIGDKVLITPVWDRTRFEAFRDKLRATPSLVLVSASKLLEVYEVVGSSALDEEP